MKYFVDSSGKRLRNDEDFPRKLWMSSPNEDGEHQIWFDVEDGGCLYLRCDVSPSDIGDNPYREIVDLRMELASVYEKLIEVDGDDYHQSRQGRADKLRTF